jgi:glycosyltransferase involved in cell wall biosynthesis
VTTVSPPDTREIVHLAGVASNVLTIPNGVDDDFLDPLPEPARHRAVAFWGNLAFGPNLEALRFFVHEVYRPVLRPAEVGLCIFGPNAPRWLTELAAEDPGIGLPGFVPDLRAAVGRYPLMVNPMRTGSGLKNKVLEAFGVGLVVVSTPLGVEALPTAQDGVHFVAAQDGASFGLAIMDLLEDEPRRLAIRGAANALLHEHYRWDIVGSTWRALFQEGRGTGTLASDAR